MLVVVLVSVSVTTVVSVAVLVWVFLEVLNDDCRNINQKADVIHLGYISNTLDFLEHAHSNLNDEGIAIFHEAYNNSWLRFKKRSDWGSMMAINTYKEPHSKTNHLGVRDIL